MPMSWKRVFNNIEPGQLAPLLSNTKLTVVWPLSILAVQALLAKLNIPRQVSEFKADHIFEIDLNSFNSCISGEE